MKAKPFTIGLDLGGTKIFAGIVDSQAKIVSSVKIPTELKKYSDNPDASVKMTIGKLADGVESLMYKMSDSLTKSAKQIQGIGLASAGPLNVESGILSYPCNFPGWKRVPIIDLLKKELKRRGIILPLYFQNDAIGAALGEGWCGAAKGCQNYVLITLGTGIGTGVIFQGRPAQSKGMGSEWGHLIIEKNVYLKEKNFYASTVEGIASGTAIFKRAQALGFQGSGTEDVVVAIRNGEEQYRQLFLEAAGALAVLCYNLSIGFRLDKIILSGGLIHVRDLFLDELKQQYEQLVEQINKDFKCPIQISKVGDKAGLIGAARLPRL